MAAAWFVPGCNEKHGREMKDLNPAEEGDFSCKLRWLEPSERKFNSE